MGAFLENFRMRGINMPEKIKCKKCGEVKWSGGYGICSACKYKFDADYRENIKRKQKIIMAETLKKDPEYYNNKMKEYRRIHPEKFKETQIKSMFKKLPKANKVRLVKELRMLV